MSVGGYGTQEAQLSKLAELKTELVSKEAFDVLKREMRKHDSNSASDMLDRLHYAKKLMRARSTDSLNKKIVVKVTRLQLEAARMQQSAAQAVEQDDETKELMAAIPALAEFVLDRLADKEWEALSITLDRPRPGLRIAPDLARLLLTEDDPRAAMRRYRKEAERAMEAAPFSFRANAISSSEGGNEKKGPAYFVPFLESSIDWKTGSSKGKYLFMMARYETDTKVNGPIMGIANMALHPGPEHEGLGFELKQDRLGRLKAVAALSRIHWIPYVVPIELVETTRSGSIKVTCMPDTHAVIYGHGFAFVTKHPESVYQTIIKLNPELHRITHLGQGEFLRIAMQQAPGWYKEGEKHESVPLLMSLRSVTNGSDALNGSLRPWNSFCCEHTETITPTDLKAGNYLRA